MKDDLIAVLSHELRTPLNAIMSWTHVLKLRGGSDETIRGLAAIERNGNIQARMISDILDMSRFNLGKMRLTLETVDPAETVTAAINAMRPSTDAEGASLRARRRAAVPADPRRQLAPAADPLEPAQQRDQVLAARQRDPHRAAPRSATACASRVADQGRGIDPEFLPFLFDRFTQSDAAQQPASTAASGLGLSIVKQLVEAHGGTVAARSDGLGPGQRVRDLAAGRRRRRRRAPARTGHRPSTACPRSTAATRRSRA